MGTKYKYDINDDLMDAWLSALRSGEYTQTRGELVVILGENEYAYCCLGVATAVCGHEVKVSTEWQAAYFEVDESRYGLLMPHHVAVQMGIPKEYLSITGPSGVIVLVDQRPEDNDMGLYGKIKVSFLNDYLRRDFNYIADRLEETFLKEA